MNKYLLITLVTLQISSRQVQANELEIAEAQINKAQKLQTNVAQALPKMLQNIKQNYAYIEQRNINWRCLNQQYTGQIKQLKNRAGAVLFFEHLLLEFADSHMTLNTNTEDSYRLNAPLVVEINQQTFTIADFWQNQLVDSGGLTIGAELVTINGKKPEQVIKNFPSLCLDKTQIENQQWIINKALAGQYSKPRIIEITVNDKLKIIDLDRLQYHETNQPLDTEVKGEFGLIKINNSLGQTQLIEAFDQAINQLNETKGLILDLRNTISGGDSYIARAIIGRLIDQERAYQKHRFEEYHQGGPRITRLWTEFVTPRLPTYEKPIVVLVNRWTGSMGEGLTIGLQGMQRAHVIGSPMAGLLGAVYGFKLEGMGFGYQMPAEQLFHVNGTPRELFLPDTSAKPNKQPDSALNQAIQWLGEQPD